MNTDSRLMYMNIGKVMATAMGVKRPPEMFKTDEVGDAIVKIFELSRKLWLSKSNTIRKRYFTTIDVCGADVSDYDKLEDAINQVVDLINSSRITEVVGKACLAHLYYFITLKLKQDSGGNENMEISSSDFVKLNGEIYVRKSGVCETIQTLNRYFEVNELASRKINDIQF